MTYDELSATLPMSKNISLLREPLCVAGKKIPNRLAVQPMEGADGTRNGAPDALVIRRYDRFAKSGAGLIWFEATAVCHEGRANPRQLYLHEKNADDFKRLVTRIRENAFKENKIEPVLIMQATHSGRYSKPDGKPAPAIACNNPFYEKENKLPPETILSDDEIKKIEELYPRTAQLAAACGFDGMDIKACHRYLNSELLSAFTRPGIYGGALENRTRFFRNCIENVKNAAPSGFIVTSRMNIYDGIPYPYGFGVKKTETASSAPPFAFSPEDAEPDLSEPAEVIKKINLPFINITMGNPYFNPQVNRPTDLAAVERMYRLTKQIKDAAGCLVVSSAPTFLREFSPYLSAGAVEKGYSDIVGYGRMAFAYPDFARDTLHDTFDRKKACVTCGKCTELMRVELAGCAVRDPVYTELYKALKKG